MLTLKKFNLFNNWVAAYSSQEERPPASKWIKDLNLHAETINKTHSSAHSFCFL